MKQAKTKSEQRGVRHRRITAKVIGSAKVPRLSVYRSNSQIYAQLIDDRDGKTLGAASDLKATKGNKMEKAEAVGKEIAEIAKKAGVSKVVFDRGGFLYAGRIKALAESARKSGLEF